MIFVFPALPIIIAIFILVISIGQGIADSVDILSIVSCIIFSLISGGMLLYWLMEKRSWREKGGGIAISIVASTLGIINTLVFFSGLSEEAQIPGLEGAVSFVFCLIVGGLIWLVGAGFALYASYITLCDDDENYLAGVGSIIVSGVVCGIQLYLTS